MPPLSKSMVASPAALLLATFAVACGLGVWIGSGNSGRTPRPAVASSSALHFNRSRESSATPRGEPYTPRPIVDPTADVDCKETCGPKYDSCPDFPSRICTTHEYCGKDLRICLHKELWPWIQTDLGLFLAVFMIGIFSSAAGIGGGGLNVPVLMMISTFNIKEAVPLSHAAVMGNAFAQLLFNVRQAHPKAPHRPLIHYELALLVLPAQLGGNSLGVVIGRVFPSRLLMILSLAMLALASTKTFFKGVDLLRATSAKRAPRIGTALAIGSPSSNLSSPTPPAESNTTATQPLGCGEPSCAPPREPSSSRTWQLVSEELERAQSGACPELPVRTWSGTRLPHRSISGLLSSDGTALPLAWSSASSYVGPYAVGGLPPPRLPAASPFGIALPEKMRVPWTVIGIMVAFNVVCCFDFMAMSQDVFGIKRCSAFYWVSLFGLYPFVVGALFIGAYLLRVLAAWHVERGDPPVDGDPQITTRLLTLFPVVAVLIGLLSGLIGLGGGEFMLPLLLEFGLVPRMASATSGFLILFTTSSNIIHYLVAGTVEHFFGYVISVFFCAMAGAIIGLTIRDTAYLRSHSYVLVFLLATLLVVSAILLAIRGFILSTTTWDFGVFC